MKNEKWGPGPWDDEIDSEDGIDAETGYWFAIRRMPHIGHLCGYVGVPEGHALHGKHYDGLYDIDVHGCITFASEGLVRPVVGRWWFGFDCAHCGDLCPAMRELRSSQGESYRDVEFVRAEVKKLAKQLKERA